MHHPRSTTTVIRFRLAAFLLIGNFVCGFAAAGFLLRSLMVYDHRLTLIGLGFLMLVLILVVVQWIMASDASCPLCRTPVLAPKLCMKHRRARSFLGSYRLRVATAIVFKNQFRCPYCNESTGMELRAAVPLSQRKI